MVVRFRCGHEQTVPDTYAAAPRCGLCGEDVVESGHGAPAAVYGHGARAVRGDEDLGAIPVRLSKESSDG